MKTSLRAHPSTTTTERPSLVTQLTTPAPRPPRPAAAHREEQPFDVSLFGAVFALLGIGVVMVYSSSVATATRGSADPNLALISHLKHIAVGLLAFTVGMSVDYQRYRKVVYPALLGAMGLLLMTLLMPADKAEGAISYHNSARWLKLGGLQFQPSEVVKFAFVVYLAYSLEKKVEAVKTFTYGFLPHLVVGAILVTMCLQQPDLGTALLLATILMAMQFLAGSKMTTIAAFVLVAIPLAVSYMLSSRSARILAYLDPFAVRDSAGYQPVQSILAIGSGGWTGLGLGDGYQKHGYLTQAGTDFIFAAIGEELGFMGCAVVVALFVWLCVRGYRVAWKAPDRFGRYLAFGITTLFGVQAFVNMAVATTVLPTKGLNLPFVSGGGTSMLVSCLAMGVLMNVSRYAEAPSTWKPRFHSGEGLVDFAKLPARKKSTKKAEFKGQKGTGVSPFTMPRNTR